MISFMEDNAVEVFIENKDISENILLSPLSEIENIKCINLRIQLKEVQEEIDRILLEMLRLKEMEEYDTLELEGYEVVEVDTSSPKVLVTAFNLGTSSEYFIEEPLQDERASLKLNNKG